MSDPVMIQAPWTLDQVRSLNGYQQASGYHPFTCRHCTFRPLLVATTQGWECPCCDYTQDWAGEWMADWSWVEGIADRPTAIAPVQGGERSD